MRFRRESLFLYGVLLRIGRGKFLCNGGGLHEPRQQSENQRPDGIKDNEACSNHCVEVKLPRQNVFIYIIAMEHNNWPAVPAWLVSPRQDGAEKDLTYERKGFGMRGLAIVVLRAIQPWLKTESELRIMAE